MDEDDRFDDIVEACINAGELVMEHGSEDLQFVMRLLLYRLGQEIASREPSPDDEDRKRSGATSKTMNPRQRY